VEQDEYDTAVLASIGDVADCTARADAQVKNVLEGVLAQRRSTAVASAYVAALSPGTRADCWSLAESAGHESWGRMQALLGSYRWDWKDLRAQLPGLAAVWIPDADGDLIGPGIAIDETAQLKHGDATACVAPQHAGCTGQVENCVTHRVRRLRHRERASLGGLRCVHTGPLGAGYAAPPRRRDPR
jgi:DDE superfamily endonuclease